MKEGTCATTRPARDMSGAGDPVAERFRAGDPDVVAEATRMVRNAVHTRGFYIPAEERGDVIQEAMVQLWQYFADPDHRVPRSFPAIVRTIAYRRCVDWMRRHNPSEPVSDTLESPAASPETRALEREKVAIGRYVLSCLGDSCRDLIQRHAGQQLTFREIAESQGRLEKTVRNQMYKCLQQARQIVDRMQRRERLGLRVYDKTP